MEIKMGSMELARTFRLKNWAYLRNVAERDPGIVISNFELVKYHLHLDLFEIVKNTKKYLTLDPVWAMSAKIMVTETLFWFYRNAANLKKMKTEQRVV